MSHIACQAHKRRVLFYKKGGVKGGLNRTGETIVRHRNDGSLCEPRDEAGRRTEHVLTIGGEPLKGRALATFLYPSQRV